MDIRARVAAFLVVASLFATSAGAQVFRIVDQGKPGSSSFPWPVTCVSGCGTAAAVLMGDATANPTIPQTAVFNMVYNTATWDRMRGDTTNGVWVNLKSSVVLHAIIDSGTTVVTQPTAANLNATVAQGAAAALTAAWPSTNGTGTAVTTTITSSTTVDSTLSIATAGMGSAWVTITPTGTVSTGTVTFETSDDGGTTWKSILGARQDTQTSLSVSISITTSTQWSFGLAGALTNFRVRLNPVMTGTGSVVVRIQTSGAPITPTTGILNTVSVNVSTLNGTSVVNGGLAGTLAVGGTQANNAAITANPVLGGGEVMTDGTSPTAATAGNIRRFETTVEGVQLVTLDHPKRFRCTVTVSTATTLTAFGSPCAAPGASLALYVTDIIAGASASGIAADAFTTLKYGTGGTCGTGTTVFWGAISAAANITVQSFAVPLKIPLNNEICWINSTAGSKFINVSGYIAP
jgi:hypothetical protein